MTGFSLLGELLLSGLYLWLLRRELEPELYCVLVEHVREQLPINLCDTNLKCWTELVSAWASETKDSLYEGKGHTHTYRV